jgi:hypothetical protein
MARRSPGLFFLAWTGGSSGGRGPSGSAGISIVEATRTPANPITPLGPILRVVLTSARTKTPQYQAPLQQSRFGVGDGRDPSLAVIAKPVMIRKPACPRREADPRRAVSADGMAQQCKDAQRQRRVRRVHQFSTDGGSADRREIAHKRAGQCRARHFSARLSASAVAVSSIFIGVLQRPRLSVSDSYCQRSLVNYAPSALATKP